VVYIGEEFADIAFENEAGMCIILRSLPIENPEPIYGFVRSFIYSAGI
jgi:hypothetical protein